MAQSKDNTNGSDADKDNAPRFIAGAQYVKDLSYENPEAPVSLFSVREKPNVDLNVDLNAQRLQEDSFEVSMHITAKATSQKDKKVIFLVELNYAGIFTLSNIPEEIMERTLLVDCPFILFPYARRVVSDVTRDGGFPPLALEPIDFASLYAQRKGQEQDKKEA